MIKQAVKAAVVLLMLPLIIPTAASAHVLKVDGDIGAVLHIIPDDNPTTGAPTDYILSFDDNTGKFRLSLCDCNVSIIENGKTITTRPLVITSEAVSENHYTFETPAVYTIRVAGTPKTMGTFQPFTINYDVRVTNGHVGTQPIPILLWVGIGMGVGLLLLAAIALDYTSDEFTKKQNRSHQ